MYRSGFVCLLLIQFMSFLNLWSEETASKPDVIIEARLVSEPPSIDGVLDDVAWQEAPIPLPEWLSYNPLFGDRARQRTDVWISYDSANLYFAFRCHDPEPDRIKTSISRRDTILNDDWIGMSLDSMGTGQYASEMMVNPSGIQADLRYGTNFNEDSTPDWVWESAGRTTEYGYNVEIRLPFRSIRFKSGDEVRMGIILFRKISRLGLSVSYPHLPPGEGWMTRHASLLLREVKQPPMLEAIPSVTYGMTQNRTAPTQWGKADSNLDAGLSIKYGITSSITLDGTINPDFSQVESDAFQVEVNQRYPVFYSEKRPFFMEGMGNFDLAGTSSGDGNMWTAVHTRRIVNPLYGLKLTGAAGRFSFSTLSASDRMPDREEGDESKEFHVGRALFTLSKGSYAGALFADTEFAGGYNRVMAADTLVRIGKNQSWSATAITSHTLVSQTGENRNGMAGQIGYSYGTRRYTLETQVEHYDRDFQMDTAFYKRTGFTSGWVYSSINFYPHAEEQSWLKRFSPFLWVRHGKDRVQGGMETTGVMGIQTSFTRQGFFRIDGMVGREPWAGREFSVRRAQMYGNAQFTEWLRIFGQLRLSRSIYYDPVEPFSGNSRNFTLEMLVQPNAKFSQSISYQRVRFDRASTGARVYSVDIVNTRSVYQFNRHFFLRSILQYDSSRTRVLGDFVASYELIPGTVVYAGYGSLFEKREWDEEHPDSGRGDYVNTQRTLFFKVSYLFRL